MQAKVGTAQPLHFKGLNGLRAIAAMGVVFFHVTGALEEYDLPGMFRGKKLVLYADFWVTVFFTLSGFLITYLLLVEKAKQDVSIKNFYIRRVLRIWPLYYLVLIISLIVIYIFHLYFNIGSLISYVLLAANIPFVFGGRLPNLAHYWSLGVEEQFYLFWPWVVKKYKRLRLITVVLIILLVVGKILFRFYSADGYNSLGYQLLHYNRFQCMLIGALGAIWYYEGAKLFILVTDNRIAQLLCWIAILLVALNHFKILSFIDHELISLATLTIIIGQINIKNRLINLENRIFDFLGRISFGIYVIHGLVMYFAFLIINPMKLHYMEKIILIYLFVIVATVILSYVSHEFYERPFLKLKQRFTVIKSRASIPGIENPDTIAD